LDAAAVKIFGSDGLPGAAPPVFCATHNDYTGDDGYHHTAGFIYKTSRATGSGTGGLLLSTPAAPCQVAPPILLPASTLAPVAEHRCSAGTFVLLDHTPVILRRLS
jgi:hypothetical protein